MRETGTLICWATLRGSTEGAVLEGNLKVQGGMQVNANLEVKGTHTVNGDVVVSGEVQSETIDELWERMNAAYEMIDGINKRIDELEAKRK